ncbi:carbohydrate-binding module family 50 protein [Auriscalpium vulgare]|uniref:Carbohydrate-binding module family 50 protein n=1 Tax=Auriscalpium vulgare TaxID=40419 RepID=A0ACB8S5V6_9AGAM|nr:carbohydrate-binding module family 50 protein [Auriscalpium vulgare]
MLATPAAFLSLFLWGMSLSSVNADGPRPTCYETYKISTGDSCSTIYSWSEITPSQIQSLNPGIQCNSLTPGQFICLASYTPTCTLNVTATDTSCVPIATFYNLTTAGFYQLNDNVDSACDNLLIGSPYCVSTADCYYGNPDPWCD